MNLHHNDLIINQMTRKFHVQGCIWRQPKFEFTCVFFRTRVLCIIQKLFYVLSCMFWLYFNTFSMSEFTPAGGGGVNALELLYFVSLYYRFASPIPENWSFTKLCFITVFV